MKTLLKIVFAAFSLNSFSQEAAVNINVQTSDEAAPVTSLTSEQNREEKKFSAFVNTGIDFGSMGSGLGFGYFYNPNSIFEAAFFTAEDRENESVDQQKYSYGRYNESTDAISLSLRYFTSNSFFVKPGVFYSKYKFVDTGTVFLGSSDIKREDLGASLGIGNQWQWKNLSFGCEWFGVQSGLINLSKVGRNDTVLSGLDSRGNGSTWVSLSFLKLGLGLSF